MDATTPRKGRFRTGPRISRYTGEPLALELQDEDAKLLHSLAFHYHYLSPQYIAPLWGRSYNATTIRTAKLLDCGYLRLAPEQQHNSKHYFRGPLFYAIAKKGVKALQERGINPPKRTAPTNLRHQVMVDQMMASIEIGVNQSPHLNISWWEQILVSQKTPEATRKSGSAYVLLGTDTRGDKRYLHADGQPFILQRSFTEKTEYMFFIGKEADCDTESIPVIEEKFGNYVEMLLGKLHTIHFGARRATVIVGAPTEARLLKLMAAWEKVTAKHTDLRKAMLFVKHPTFQSFENPRPTGHMTTEPLRRVGLPPIILGKPQEV